MHGNAIREPSFRGLRLIESAMANDAIGASSDTAIERQFVFGVEVAPTNRSGI